jgi:predicted acyl esterase
MNSKVDRQNVFRGDETRMKIAGYRPLPQPVPSGTNVEGVYFDGYPQIVKNKGSKPLYKLIKEKNVMVPMQDGVRIAVDIYRPDAEGEKFPALLAWGIWGKDAQEAIEWLKDKPQPYFDSPFWDGVMEAMDFTYTVPRGYIHVIPEPRGVGNSEGYGSDVPIPFDVYNTIEWIAAQPWCDGRVGMMGPSSYSISQIQTAALKPPHLVALRPDENPCGTWDSFNGVFDLLTFHILTGRHGNDSALPAPNYEFKVKAPRMLSLPDIDKRLEEALNYPDIKYNTKWASYLKYPMKLPDFFDDLLNWFHPRPMTTLSMGEMALNSMTGVDNIDIPIYLGSPWNTRFYLWPTFDVWEHVGTSPDKKKLILYPPGFPDRPYIEYHDELIRWYDYHLKGIDTGIMDEPPVKMFVMGINQWRFENEWPLKRTDWAKFYLLPQGGLSTEVPNAEAEPDTFYQPAPYLDPTVYCLRYSTGPLDKDMEITGPLVLNLWASIDIDDTNWLADLVDVTPEGNRFLVSSGALKAAHRAIDESRSKPYRPVHPRQDPVPVPPGEIIEYAIAMMPTANVFKKGHSIELIVRNQDDVLSRLGTWGVYYLPFMQSVRHKIYFGQSHLLLPVIPY